VNTHRDLDAWRLGIELAQRDSKNSTGSDQLEKVNVIGHGSEA
jgi:hypothetical protein